MIPPLWASITVGMILFLCLPHRLLSRPWMAIVTLLLCLGVACLPVNGLPVSAWVRGAIDDLSIMSMMLLALNCFSHYSQRTLIQGAERKALTGLVVMAALILYPASLGMSMTDPWQWGFEPRWMIIMVGVLAVTSCLLGWWSMAMLLSMSTLAFTMQLKESTNFWDYLLDPLLVIVTMVQIIRSRAYTRETGTIARSATR